MGVLIHIRKMKTDKKTEAPLLIHPPQFKRLKFWIRGTSPLVQHAWSEKALRMLRMTAAERKKEPKVARDPEGEGKAACHRTKGGGYGIPAMAIKAALCAAAHKDLGLPRTTVQKALHFDRSDILPMECDEPGVNAKKGTGVPIREDIVRVGMNQTDLRYRPEFISWAVPVSLKFDASFLSAQDVINLATRAGFGVGLHENRPEKGGEWGMFEVDPDRPVEIEDIKTVQIAA